GIRDRNVTGVQTCALPMFDLKCQFAPVVSSLSGYCIREWNMPFNASQTVSITSPRSYKDSGVSENCPSIILLLTIELTISSIFSGDGSFKDRTAASTESQIDIMPASFVSGLGPG